MARAMVPLLFLACITWAGCGQEESVGSVQRDEAPLLAPVDGEPVARVDGVAITDTQVEALMRRSGGGITREDALAQLVATEVLAQRAVELGLDEDASVRVTKRRAMVQRLLEEAVEKEHPSSSVPDEQVRQAYESFGLDFFVPDLVRASHVLVDFDAQHAPANVVAKARAIASLMREQLLERGLSETELARVAAAATLEGYVARHEKDLTFPRRPVTPMFGEQPPYESMVEPFADAAFALSEEEPLSEPVLTPFGVHLIKFQKKVHGVRPPFEVVEDEIRHELQRRARHRHLRMLVERLLRDASIEVDETPIDELAERAGEAAP